MWISNFLPVYDKNYNIAYRYTTYTDSVVEVEKTIYTIIILLADLSCSNIKIVDVWSKNYNANRNTMSYHRLTMNAQH